jgi:hypothetical protein
VLRHFIDHLGNYHSPSTYAPSTCGPSTCGPSTYAHSTYAPSTYSPSTCPLASTAALPFSFVHFGLRVHNRFEWLVRQRKHPLNAPRENDRARLLRLKPGLPLKALREHDRARLQRLKPSLPLKAPREHDRARLLWGLVTSTMRITTYAHQSAPSS